MESKNIVAFCVAIGAAALLTGCGGPSCVSDEIAAKLMERTGYAKVGGDGLLSYINGFTGQVVDAEKTGEQDDRVICTATTEVTGSVKDHFKQLLGDVPWISKSMVRSMGRQSPEFQVISEAINTIEAINSEFSGELVTLRQKHRYTVSKDTDKFIGAADSDASAMADAMRDLQGQAQKILDKQREQQARNAGYDSLEHQKRVAEAVANSAKVLQEASVLENEAATQLRQLQYEKSQTERRIDYAKTHLDALKAAAQAYEEQKQSGVVASFNPYITFSNLRIEQRRYNFGRDAAYYLAGTIINTSKTTVTEIGIATRFWADLTESFDGARHSLSTGGGLAPGEKSNFSIALTNRPSYDDLPTNTDDFVNSKKRAGLIMVTDVQTEQGKLEFDAERPADALLRATEALESGPQAIQQFAEKITAAEQRLKAATENKKDAEKSYQAALNEKKTIEAKRKT